MSATNKDPKFQIYLSGLVSKNTKPSPNIMSGENLFFIIVNRKEIALIISKIITTIIISKVFFILLILNS